MKIQDLNSALRGIDPRDAQRVDRATTRPKGADPKSEDGDALELSSSAKISLTSSPSSAADEISPARVAEIQGRIQSGFYSQPSVIAETAQRLASFYSR